MAVVDLAHRSAAQAPAPAPSEVLTLRGTAASVAAVLARMINEGWVFDALPMTRGRGMWLVSARRPAQQDRLQLRDGVRRPSRQAGLPERVTR
jgi:hypothetical protein